MTANNDLHQLTLPALRGVMGDWLYYTCLMTLEQVANRVRFAEELRPSRPLSALIQRTLDQGRGKKIAHYLRTQPERLFSSLVVATYEGEPHWYSLSHVQSTRPDRQPPPLTTETLEQVGFLSLRGDEQLFALDGQHRLAGIKRAVQGVEEGGPNQERVSVIFVAHEPSQRGLQRVRRLFTTLNKNAKTVAKRDIIALDEDDVMAICVRRLIEEEHLFDEYRLAFVARTNVPATNTVCLTTICSLYDVLQVLFTKSNFGLRRNRAALRFERPPEEELDVYFEHARTYVTLLRDQFPELQEFFAANDTEPIVKKYRGSHGGNALFRPIGLDIFTHVISRLTNQMPLHDAVELATKLPRCLSKEPYQQLMWDPNNQVMVNSHKVLVRETLSYMIGVNGPRYPASTLLQQYKRATGKTSLPRPVA